MAKYSGSRIVPTRRYVFVWNGIGSISDAPVEPMPPNIYERHSGQPVQALWVSHSGPIAHVIAEDQEEFLAYDSELEPVDSPALLMEDGI